MKNFADLHQQIEGIHIFIGKAVLQLLDTSTAALLRFRDRIADALGAGHDPHPKMSSLICDGAINSDLTNYL